MMNPTPTPQHTWLKQLVGDWAFTNDCVMGPGGETSTFEGTETVRALGDIWIVADTALQMPEGVMHCVLTLGFDPLKDRFVGTWVGSPMTRLITYEGTLDDAKKILTLDCEGPSFEDPTKTATYQDVLEILSPNERTFSSQILQPDGTWFRFMHGTYRRN